MSLTQYLYPQTLPHLLPSTGDTDQDPELTDIWFSFEEEESESSKDRSRAQSLAYLDNEDYQLEQDKAHTLAFLEKNELDIIPDYLKNNPLSLPDLTDDLEPLKLTFLKKDSLEEKIEEVKKGNLVQNRFRKVQQDFRKGARVFDKEELVGMLQKNYRKNKEGTIEIINKDHIKKQKQVLGYLLRQFGYKLFSGRFIMKVSLPTNIFEPRSHLERQAQSLVYAPHFLEKGGSTRSTFEQFKMAITHFIASLHCDINPQKPFNPILGETFQGIIGGCPVYLEQISHHPPVSAFQMIGKNFRVEGNLESNASLSINSVKGRKLGYVKIIYKNNRTVVQAHYPTSVLSGIAFGKMSVCMEGKFQIFDLGNQYYAEIDFDMGKDIHRLQEKEHCGKDYFSGSIWKITEDFAGKMRRNIKLKFNEKEHAIWKIEDITGLWMEHLKIGDHTYWAFRNPWPYQMQYFDEVLPSDSNNRLDVLFLKQGDDIKAQEEKKALEERQRKDKKLRESAKIVI